MSTQSRHFWGSTHPQVLVDMVPDYSRSVPVKIDRLTYVNHWLIDAPGQYITWTYVFNSNNGPC